MSPKHFILFDPRLIEEAVFLRLRNHPQSGLFYKERERIYETADPEERERAFQECHRCWFLHLTLGDPILKAVHEHPLLSARVKNCVVARAPGKKEEGAELFVDPEGEGRDKETRTVRILLRPESLLEPLGLLSFLRHELFHITDMLDPAFGYEPALPAGTGGPSHDRLLQERYRALWDTAIDGRMVRRGWADEALRARRLADFRRAFSMLGESSDQFFGRFFDQEPHTHAQLAAFALDPMSATETIPERPHAGSRCPLCAFPSHAFEEKPEELPKEVIDLIVHDFPHWQPERGLCRQCADLYRARPISAKAATALPGARLHP